MSTDSPHQDFAGPCAANATPSAMGVSQRLGDTARAPIAVVKSIAIGGSIIRSKEILANSCHLRIKSNRANTLTGAFAALAARVMSQTMRRAATILSSRIEDPSKRCPCPSPQQFEAVAYCRCRIIHIAALPNGVRPDLRDRKSRLLADHVRLEAGELSASLLAALSTVEHIDDPLLVLRPQRLLQPVRVCHHSTLARRAGFVINNRGGRIARLSQKREIESQLCRLVGGSKIA
jgi:hypothetical protein